MNVAVTGGTGCLGRPLVEKLIADGAYPRLLTLPNDSSITFVDEKAEIITGNLNLPDALDKLCMDCDVVFHLASLISISSSSSGRVGRPSQLSIIMFFLKGVIQAFIGFALTITIQAEH